VRVSLAADEVAVGYQLSEGLDAAALGAMAGVLSDEERARRDRFVFDRDRRDFVAAHALVRRMLSRYGETEPADWRFDTDAHGKPSVVPAQAGTPPLVFNLSHTHGLVACAVARATALGIDVERVDRMTLGPEIATRYFAAAEIRMLNAQAAERYAERFIELWTLKEAYIKAVGTGLAHPLDSFAFGFEGSAGLRFAAPPGVAAPDWQFLLAVPTANTRLAIAVSGSANRPWRIAMQRIGPDTGAAVRPIRSSTATLPAESRLPSDV
jgi:4'-phosphopantetheinyl transferase